MQNQESSDGGGGCGGGGRVEASHMTLGLLRSCQTGQADAVCRAEVKIDQQDDNAGTSAGAVSVATESVAPLSRGPVGHHLHVQNYIAHQPVKQQRLMDVVAGLRTEMRLQPDSTSRTQRHTD